MSCISACAVRLCSEFDLWCVRQRGGLHAAHTRLVHLSVPCGCHRLVTSRSQRLRFLIAGFVALNAAVGSLPGVQDRHLHALFRAFDYACNGTLAPEALADAVYGPGNHQQEELVKYAFQVLPSLGHCIALLDMSACCSCHGRQQLTCEIKKRQLKRLKRPAVAIAVQCCPTQLPRFA